jgi:hypothetical protein
MAQPTPFPQLTHDQAKAALDEAIAAFEIPSNKEKMEQAIASCAGMEPPQKMMILLPIVQEIQTEAMERYGFTGPGAVMAGTMQIQMHAMQDPEMQEKVKFLMSKVAGN